MSDTISHDEWIYILTGNDRPDEGEQHPRVIYEDVEPLFWEE